MNNNFNLNKNRSMKKSKRKSLKKRQTLKHRYSARPALWSVPAPKHDLCEVNGRVRLYHYTPIDRVGSIMTHGLIKGDVVGGLDEVDANRNWNAPNLTAENKFHNPANAPDCHLSSVRLEIQFDATDKNIIPYDWFDQTYCGGQNVRLIALGNARGGRNGNINDQFLYRGPIPPKMIKKFSVWNQETGYWDRLSKNQISDLIKEYEERGMSYAGMPYLVFDWSRMCGFSLNDWTGQVRSYYQKTDGKEVMAPLYALTDFINDNLKGRRLRNYKIELYKFRFSKSIYETSEFIIKTYNKISREPVGTDWFQDLRKRQIQCLEDYAVKEKVAAN